MSPFLNPNNVLIVMDCVFHRTVFLIFILFIFLFQVNLTDSALVEFYCYISYIIGEKSRLKSTKVLVKTYHLNWLSSITISIGSI